MSILNSVFKTVHDTAPFSQIKTSDYLPAFEQALALTRAEVNRIVNNTEPASFENTIEAMAFSGMQLDRISTIFFNLHSAETNDEMDRIAQEVAPQLAELANDITLNQDLFNRIKQVYENRENLTLTSEQETLLEKSYKDFTRNGALLADDDKEKLRKIDAELAVVKLKFGENVLAETNAYQLHITKEEDLQGLPAGTVEAAQGLAESLEKEGWIFTLDYPSYIPFVTYADNRALRKEITIAAGSKAFQANEYNNETHVLKIVNLRFQRAQLLGYNTHADFVLEERMAQSANKVNEFLEDLLVKAKPAALREFDELQQFARDKDGITALEKWDGAYYSEKLKQQKFDLDDEKLKPYFNLDYVLSGAFQVADKLFGLKFTEVDNIDKYHPDVQTFEVRNEDGSLTAIFTQTSSLEKENEMVRG